MPDSTDARMGGRLLRALDRALMVVETTTAAIGGLVIFAVMFVGVAEILLRKLFNSPLYGQLDLVEQTMSAYAILTISFCYRKAGHIRVEILAQHYKGRGRWIAELLTSLAAWEKRGLIAIKYSDAELKKFADLGAKPVWDAWVKENAAKGVPAQELLDLVLKEAEAAKKKLGKS